MDGVCDVAGCARETVDAGLCNGHVLRWIRLGRPSLPEYVRTTRTVVVEAASARKANVAEYRGTPGVNGSHRLVADEL